MVISIIGAGRMASQFGLELHNAGHEIVEIYNRSFLKGKALAKSLGARPVKNIEILSPRVDFLIISVSDDAIETIANQLNSSKWSKVTVLHTSGSVKLEVLKDLKKAGVLYPFQSMTEGQQLDFKTVPVLISGNSLIVFKQVEKLALTISEQVFKTSDKQRGTVHLAGVFANNFANHMIVLAKDILDENELSFEIIKPLIQNTVEKIKNIDPVVSQTGPALRGDSRTIIEHLKLLESKPDLHVLYGLLTKNIIDRHKEG